MTDAMEDFQLLIVQTGGTIDKDYPKRKGGYYFELCDSGALSVLRKVLPSFSFRLVTPCLQDSQDLTSEHRQQIVKACQEAPERYILITHGTDTILHTAAFIAAHLHPPSTSPLHPPPSLPHHPHPSDPSPATTHFNNQSETPNQPRDPPEAIANPNNQSATTTHSGSQSETAVPGHVDQSSASSLASREDGVGGGGCSKVIVLTGAFLPERFKDTDADFNVGVAVGAMQGRLSPGVYVALGGRVRRWDHVTRSENGQFVSASRS